MCRLAFVTRRFKTLPQWLEQLERSNGGHGNGVVTADGEVYKGVDLRVEDTLCVLRGTRAPALWHSRRVSSGPKCDELCHPFDCAGGWLVHNGHWSWGDFAAEIFQDLLGGGHVSDTRLFSKLVDKMGFAKATAKYKPSGVWLWMNGKGKLSAYKNGGSLYYSANLQCWGSEPAPQGHWFQVKDGLYPAGVLPKEPEPEPELVKANNQRLFDSIEINIENGKLQLGSTYRK